MLPSMQTICHSSRKLIVELSLDSLDLYSEILPILL